MFTNPFKNEAKDNIKTEIKRLTDILVITNPETDEYKDTVKAIEDLKKVYDSYGFSVKPDTVLTSAAYLVGICLVINHEKLNVITSKAFSHIPKP